MTTQTITATTRALIDVYYGGIAHKSGWEDAIADGFVFTGGNPNNGSRGKAAYAEVMRQFGRVYETVEVKRAIVSGDSACVIATYGVVSPSGKKRSVDIAEVWTAEHGQLASLTIYFDTAGWRAFMES
jgi:ketosteroid isomerase-like protein